MLLPGEGTFYSMLLRLQSRREFVPREHRRGAVCPPVSLSGGCEREGPRHPLPPRRLGSSCVLGVERSPATEQNQNLNSFSPERRSLDFKIHPHSP